MAQNESALILTGKNISRMAYFKQFCCSIDYCQNTRFNARFLRDRLLRKNPSFEQDSCVIDSCVKTEFSAILLQARLLQKYPNFSKILSRKIITRIRVIPARFSRQERIKNES